VILKQSVSLASMPLFLVMLLLTTMLLSVRRIASFLGYNVASMWGSWSLTMRSTGDLLEPPDLDKPNAREHVYRRQHQRGGNRRLPQ